MLGDVSTEALSNDQLCRKILQYISDHIAPINQDRAVIDYVINIQLIDLCYEYAGDLDITNFTAVEMVEDLLKNFCQIQADALEKASQESSDLESSAMEDNYDYEAIESLVDYLHWLVVEFNINVDLEALTAEGVGDGDEQDSQEADDETETEEESSDSQEENLGERYSGEFTVGASVLCCSGCQSQNDSATE